MNAGSDTNTDLLGTVRAITEGEPDLIANCANAAAVLYHGLSNVNWVGFYYRRGSELVLGPFQGKPACIRIPMGNGVCGTAASSQETLVVPDVHAFPGHIACDAASNSEIVVPLIHNGTVVGVLDVDSPLYNRFGAEEKDVLEAVTACIVQRTFSAAVSE